MLFVCHPKFCISIVFSFSWSHFNSREKLQTMLMQNFGVTNKEYYGILWYFWSGQFLITRGARRRLKQRQRCRQRKCQKSIKTTPLQVQHTFLVHFFAFSTRLPCENPWSDVLWGRWIFLSPTRLGFSPQEFNLNTGYGPEEFSSRKFAYIWPSDRVGILAMTIERKQTHFYVAFSLLSPVPIRGS